MNEYRWLIRREFWENRAIWMIPAAVIVALIVAALFGRSDVMEDAPTQAVGAMLLYSVSAIFFLVMSIYSSWYLLDCLYSDRKDKSVLFWKSLPISDAATVLSKLAMACLVIPLVYFLAADLSALLTLFIVSMRAHSLVGAGLWSAQLWLQLQAAWLYLIVTTAIWYLPVAAYLMVISAAAKRAVMLWSILPPLTLGLIESWFVGTHVIFHQIGLRLGGYPSVAFHSSPATWAAMNSDSLRTVPSIWGLLNPQGFLSNAQTLIGVAVGGALIFCAIQLRMRRAEI